MTDEVEMIEVVDTARIGKKGFPRHAAALGFEPPMKLVPKEQAAEPPPASTPTPDPNAVPASISDRQFFQQLAVLGVITEDEALAANAAIIPAALVAIIDQMPAEQQFAAKMLVSGATVFERNHPMTEAIGVSYGWTSEQIDDFFRAAAKA